MVVAEQNVQMFNKQNNSIVLIFPRNDELEKYFELKKLLFRLPLAIVSNGSKEK